MKSIVLLFAILGLCVVAQCEKVNYKNYRIYSIRAENEEHFKLLQAIENSDADLLFITPPSTKIATDIAIPPHKLSYVESILAKYEFKFDIKVEDLQSVIDEEQPKELQKAFVWTQYYDLSAIYAWLDELLVAYPNILTNYNFGKSYENRTLRAVKLSHNESNPTIFIEANIHAREWVTSATATFILNQLLTSPVPKVKELAEKYNWVFVPVFNVDGFEYTHTKNRMWRKTRQPFGSCVGSDPNRNFDFHHGESGSSNYPCAETYAGPKPFSEVETLALSEFIKTVDNLKLYISFHSYSQLLMYPYGHSAVEKPSNYKDLDDIARAAVIELRKLYGTTYRYGGIASTIYEASGGSIDWAYAKLNVPLTYTYEFRDKGRYGFLLPANQIIPNSLEVLESLVAMVDKAKTLQYFNEQ